MEDLCREMLKFANKQVDFVGRRSKSCWENYTKDDREVKHTEFALKFKECEKDNILKVWKSWVTAKVYFEKYTFKGIVNNGKAPIWLYWRVFPEWRYDEETDFHYIYARLTIIKHEEWGD